MRAAGQFRSTQHHFRMCCEILVDIGTVPASTNSLPVRFLERLAYILGSECSLFQNQNIRHNRSTGISGKRSVRQSDCTQQVRSFHDVLSHRIVSAVHGVAAGDKHHDTAGPYLIQALSKEVIVDRIGNCLGIVLVGNGVVTEGNITDCHIHVTIRDVGLLKALDTHIRIGVQVFCKQTGDIVQFHHSPALDLSSHISRHSAYEITHAGGRLQHSAAGKAQLLQAVIHGLDNFDTGIMCILGAFSGRLVLFLGKHVLEFFKLCLQALYCFILDFAGSVVGNRFTKGIC